MPSYASCTILALGDGELVSFSLARDLVVLHMTGNTVSNLAMIIPGLIGMWNCLQNGLEPRYMFCYTGLVGQSLPSDISALQ